MFTKSGFKDSFKLFSCTKNGMKSYCLFLQDADAKNRRPGENDHVLVWTFTDADLESRIQLSSLFGR